MLITMNVFPEGQTYNKRGNYYDASYCTCCITAGQVVSRTPPLSV